MHGSDWRDGSQWNQHNLCCCCCHWANNNRIKSLLIKIMVFKVNCKKIIVEIHHYRKCTEKPGLKHRNMRKSHHNTQTLLMFHLHIMTTIVVYTTEHYNTAIKVHLYKHHNKLLKYNTYLQQIIQCLGSRTSTQCGTVRSDIALRLV